MSKFKLDRKVQYTYTKEDKKKIELKELKPFLKYYKNHLGLLFSCGFFMLLNLALGIIIPILTGKLIASFTANFNADTTLTYLLYIFGFEVVSVIVSYFSDAFWMKTVAYVRYDLNNALIDRVNSIKLIVFDNQNTSKFTSRMFGDVDVISTVPLTIMNDFTSIISKVGFLAYTFTLSWEIGLFMLAYIIILITIEFTRLAMRQKQNRIIRNWGEKEDNIQYENIRGMRDVRALNSTENVLSKIDNNFRYKASLRYKFSTRNRNFNHINILLKMILFAFFVLLGVKLIEMGRLDIAGFIIAYNYQSSIRSFASSIIYIKDYLSEATLAASRINELYNEEEFPGEKFGDVDLEKVEGKIEFKNVSFKYVEDIPVLEDISFSIEPNSIVSFVGASGSGKSTISSIMCKLYSLDENNGEVLIDGVNINNLTKKSIRNNMCLVSQSPYIFDMTIKENMRFAKADATEEEIYEVLKKAELYDFIMNQPEKLETKLGENGIKLSGGQKQRLAIARALLRNAKIFIFDEATSALDNINQSKIKEVIKELAKDHTIVMIAHRLSTVVDSDKIIFIKDGKVHKEGTHKKLMRECKEYKELYQEESVEEIIEEQD